MVNDPSTADFTDFVECALDPQGAAAVVAALRAQVEAARGVVAEMRKTADGHPQISASGRGASAFWAAVLDAALNRSAAARPLVEDPEEG